MQNVKISGDSPYAGEYVLDLETTPLKWLDVHILKVVADVMPGEFDEAVERGDPDLNLALVVIALYRAGRVKKGTYAKVADELRELDVDGGIAIESDDDEPAEPDEDPSPAQSDGPDASESGVEKSASSGTSSVASSA